MISDFETEQCPTSQQVDLINALGLNLGPLGGHLCSTCTILVQVLHFFNNVGCILHWDCYVGAGWAGGVTRSERNYIALCLVV